MDRRLTRGLQDLSRGARPGDTVVSMLTWTSLQLSFMEDPALHWGQCQARGLVCPVEVFTQLFHDHVGAADVPAVTAAVDWAQIRWSEQAVSGAELRQVYIDRRFEHGVDEAYAATLEAGVTDERPSVIEAWRVEHSWRVPPVLVTGEVIGSDYPHVLLVGNSRLGNLLALLERGEVSPEHRHRVWIGRLAELGA